MRSKRVSNARNKFAAGQNSTSSLIVPKEVDRTRNRTPMPICGLGPVWPYQYMEYSQTWRNGLAGPYLRPKLRFKVGDLVQAFVAAKKCDQIALYIHFAGMGQGKWINGKVIKVWGQHEFGYKYETLMPYFIELDDGAIVWLPEDTNRCVRDAASKINRVIGDSMFEHRRQHNRRRPELRVKSISVFERRRQKRINSIKKIQKFARIFLVRALMRRTNAAARVIQQSLRRHRTKLRNVAAKVIQQSLRRRRTKLRNVAAKVIQQS